MFGVVVKLNETDSIEEKLASTELAVIDFTATWCGPCQRIAPVFTSLATKYPSVLFLKVDVDVCSNVAANYQISAMPTFVFLNKSQVVDTLKGANPDLLESKVQSFAKSASDTSGSGADASYFDLHSLIRKDVCECLNEHDDHKFGDMLTSSQSYLQSDCDAQLIVSVTFQQAVRLHSLRIHVRNGKNAPRNIRLFTNQMQTLDFEKADTMDAVQELELNESHTIVTGSKAETVTGNVGGTFDVESDEMVQLVSLNFVKFQNVNNVQLFIRDNQTGDDVTRVDRLVFIGTPLASVNMDQFKRVSGKKGESH